MSTAAAVQPAPRVGAWKGGLALARASWSTLKLDKELVAFPMYSSLMAFAWFIFMVVVSVGVFAGLAFIASHGDMSVFMAANPPATWPRWADDVIGTILGAISLFGLLVIGNYYTAALVAAAIHRFEGGDPTVKYGLERARAQLPSIVKYSLLQATVITVLRNLEERLPLIGKITAWIIDVAWSVATMFAIPVIVMSKEPIGPITAVRESATVFKKTWAKNFTGGLTMGLIFLAAIFGLFVVSMTIGGALAAVTPWTLTLTVPVFAALFVIVISIMSALNGIFIAALYHYATTGESPVQFDKDLLHAAFRPKKGWFA